MRYKNLGKLKRAIKKEEKIRNQYINAKVYTGEVAKALATEYYAAESDRNLALEFLHQYGLSHEVLSDDDDCGDSDCDEGFTFKMPNQDED